MFCFRAWSFGHGSMKYWKWQALAGKSVGLICGSKKQRVHIVSVTHLLYQEMDTTLLPAKAETFKRSSCSNNQHHHPHRHHESASCSILCRAWHLLLSVSVGQQGAVVCKLQSIRDRPRPTRRARAWRVLELARARVKPTLNKPTSTGGDIWEMASCLIDTGVQIDLLLVASASVPSAPVLTVAKW